MISTIGGDVIIQESLAQCKVLSQFNPSSLNTIRFMSLLGGDGSVTPVSAVLRMGVGGSKVDNLHSGGIVVGITPDGILRETGYNMRGDSFKSHPDTGISFAGISIPGYSKIMDILTRIHPMVPYFRLVSWDFAIDSANNPRLVEANLASGGIDVHQLANGPVFGALTNKILQEVYE